MDKIEIKRKLRCAMKLELELINLYSEIEEAEDTNINAFAGDMVKSGDNNVSAIQKMIIEFNQADAQCDQEPTVPIDPVQMQHVDPIQQPPEGIIQAMAYEYILEVIDGELD